MPGIDAMQPADRRSSRLAGGDCAARLDTLVSGRDGADLPVARIAYAVERFGGQLAFEEGGSTLSFRDVGLRADRLARALIPRFDLRPGDRVAVMLPNCVQFPIAAFANMMAGLVQVSINPNYTPAEALHQIGDSGASVLVIDSACLPIFAAIAESCPGLGLVVVGDGDAPSGAAAFDAMCEDRNLPALSRIAGKDDLVFLQYTGGTTGVSKGAMLTHGNLGANLLQFEHHLHGHIDQGSGAIFTALPMYHIFALMVNCLSGFCFGLANHLVRDPRDLGGMVDILGRVRPSIVTGVNTLFAGIAAHPRASSLDWSDLRLSLGGGTKILPAVSGAWQALTGQPIKVGYGLSETSPIVSIHTMDQEVFADHAGQPVLATDIRLIDSQGQDVKAGEPGEACVRGPQVMQGYWGQQDARAQSFTSDGYFRTGDIAIRDDRGNIDIVDRIKDMILVSGFNVYPNEVEAALAEHPAVAESICVGIPDARTGEAVKAFIVPRSAPPCERELTDFLRSKLTSYKIPRQFEFRATLPKSAVGKLLRKELKPAAAT